MSLSEAKQKLLAQRLAGKGSSRPAAGSVIGRRSDGTSDPIAPCQRRLWFQYLAQPESPSYTISSAYNVRGKLDIEQVEGAANVVLERHTILRSVFVQNGDSARLRVVDDFDLRVECFSAAPIRGRLRNTPP